MTYQTTVSANSPLSWAHMDEANTTSVADSGSAGGTYTVAGTITANQTAAGTISGSSFKFSAVSSYLSKAVSFSSSGVLTLETWFKADTTASFTDGRLMALVGNSRPVDVFISSNGDIKINYHTTGVVATAAATNAADGSWHHIMVTHTSGAAWNIYLDGTSVYSGGSNSFSNTGGTVYFGSRGTAGFVGWMDEPAFYLTELASTDASGHYSAGTAASGVSVTVLPPAASISSVSAVVPTLITQKAVTALPVVAGISLGSPVPVVTGVDNLHQTIIATADRSNRVPTDGSATSFVIFDSSTSGEQGYFRFATPTVPSGYAVSSAVVSFTQTLTGTPSFNIRKLTADWTEAGNGSISSTGSYGTLTPTTTGVASVDISALVNEWVAGTSTNYGLAVIGSGGSTGNYINVSTKDATTGKPSLAITLVASSSVTVTPPVATLTVASGAHNVATTSSVSAVAPVATVGIAATTASISVVSPNAVVAAPAAAITISTPPVLAYSPSHAVISLTGAGGLNVSALAGGFNSDTQRTILVDNAAGMTIRTVGVLNIEQDRYFKILKSTTDYDDMWLKLDEISGATAADSATTDLVGNTSVTNGAYSGGFELNTEGPQLHKAVHFDGTTGKVTAGAFQTSTTFSNMDITLEFSIKTTQSNGTILAGGPLRADGQYVSAVAGAEVRLIDGQIAIYNGGSSQTTWPVHKLVADGQWHHVVISLPGVSGQSGNLPGTLRPAPFFVAIDGKVEWTRYQTAINGTSFLPGTYMTGATGAVAGDLSNLVARTNYSVSVQTAASLYYEWSNTTLASAGAASVSIAAVNPAKAGGNVKKMIALYGLPHEYNPFANDTRDGRGNYFSVFANYYIRNDAFEENVPGGTGTIAMAGDELQVASNPVHMNYLVPKPFKLEGYMVYPTAIMHQAGSNGGPFSVDGIENYTGVDPIERVYIDDVTGLPRFIDLDTDLLTPITSFDALTVVNYPTFEPEDAYGSSSSDILREPTQSSMGLSKFEWQEARDKLRDSIMNAAYRGVNLWINEPEMAQHLGFIQAYDKHITGSRIEFASAGGIEATGYTNSHARDLNAAHMNGPISPENIGPGFGQFNFTWQANAKRKIIDLEPGLTDYSSYEVSEQVSYIADDAFAVHARWTAYDVLDRTAGLHNGDLLVMSMNEEPSSTSVSAPRAFIVSAKPQGIAGRAISKEMDTYYGRNGAVVSNPWKDNVYTIIAERGTIVGGRPIAGRAFIEFMDAATRVGKIIVDTDKTMWNGVAGLNASTWDLDTRRVKEVVYTISLISFHLATNASGTEKFVQDTQDFRYTQADSGVYDYKPFMSMNARGLNWLASAEKLNDGEVKVYAGGIDVGISSPTPTVLKTRNITVPVTGAPRLHVEAVEPRNFRGPNTTIGVLPAEISIEMRGTGSATQVGAANIGIDMPSVTILAGGDSIFVYMDQERTVTLFMKED